MNRTGQETIALHEAGHAVAARILGIEVHSVILMADGKGGVTDSSSPSFFAPDDVTALEKDAMKILAGPQAQMAYQTIEHFGPELGWDSDMAQANYFAAQLARASAASCDGLSNEALDRLTDEVMNRLVAQTNALVERHWPAITRAAAALLDKKILRQDELDKLIAEAAHI